MHLIIKFDLTKMENIICHLARIEVVLIRLYDKNLLHFQKPYMKKNVFFSNISFEKFNFNKLKKGDFVYADPPYFNSVASYNEQGGWNEEREKALLMNLDELNKKGIHFALSNNLKYDNPYLDKWKDKYNVHCLNGDYSNCNYHKIDRSKDYEVLITNY